MGYKFYSPFIIWFGIWVFISLVMWLITLQINKFHQQSSLARERLLCAGQPAGSFAQRFGLSWGPMGRHQFFPEYRPILRPERGSSSILAAPGAADERWREFSTGAPDLPSLVENFWTQRLLLQDWQSATSAGHIFTTLSYLLFVVGFGAICLISAIFQNYFRRAQEEQFEAEIEARNLSIQMLKSSRDALDLKMKLLNTNHAMARSAAHEAQENIRDLEEKLQSEAERNEELQTELQKAQLQETRALTKLRTLNRDRQKIAAEKTDILARLVEAEELAQASLYLQQIKKAKGRLRLNSFWLTSLYKNLSFSPRALQNLAEVQDAADIFPSLPDALAIINKKSIKALLSGDSLPPKTLSRFSTQDLEHFQGPFWEYRFSADGRIFFGLSKSRTFNIDTILLKRRFPDKKEKYDRYLAGILGKDNQDLDSELRS